jgi:hypothetical protein
VENYLPKMAESAESGVIANEVKLKLLMKGEQ